MPDDERREQGPSAATGSGGISRRSFPAGRRIGWRRGRPAVLGQVRRRAAGVAPGRRCRGEELAYASIADLQAALASGRLTATRLTQIYLRRIRQIDRQLGLNSVLESDAMGTRAGSLALVGRAPLQDSTVAARLRAAGAVILGKANLSPAPRASTPRWRPMGWPRCCRRRTRRRGRRT